MAKFITYNFVLCEYNQKFVYDRIFIGSPSSIAGIAAHSGLDGWEFELLCGKIFYARPDQPQGPPNPCKIGTLFLF